MANYFISDLHFGHYNCLLFDNRPFTDIDEHDTELIRRWNEAVNIDEAITNGYLTCEKTIAIVTDYKKNRK